MNTSPYTHPSMPRTPAMVLSAALEDAEGHALVAAIHRRKALEQAWQYYATLHPTYDPFKATKEKLAELDREAFPRPQRWIVGGRGHGKNRASAEWLRGREVVTDFLAGLRGDPYPWALSITWSCPRPTAPVYAVGTMGWLMEQAEARLRPEIREHNRRIAAENAAIIDRYAELLGVKPYGTDNSQVQ